MVHLWYIYGTSMVHLCSCLRYKILYISSAEFSISDRSLQIQCRNGSQLIWKFILSFSGIVDKNDSKETIAVKCVSNGVRRESTHRWVKTSLVLVSKEFRKYPKSLTESRVESSLCRSVCALLHTLPVLGSLDVRLGTEFDCDPNSGVRRQTSNCCDHHNFVPNIKASNFHSFEQLI